MSKGVLYITLMSYISLVESIRFSPTTELGRLEFMNFLH